MTTTPASRAWRGEHLWRSWHATQTLTTAWTGNTAAKCSDAVSLCTTMRDCADITRQSMSAIWWNAIPRSEPRSRPQGRQPPCFIRVVRRTCAPRRSPAGGGRRHPPRRRSDPQPEIEPERVFGPAHATWHGARPQAPRQTPCASPRTGCRAGADGRQDRLRERRQQPVGRHIETAADARDHCSGVVSSRH